MSKSIRVKVTFPHMRNQRVAGVAGREYWVNPSTQMLHPTGPEGHAAEPGVHPDCAARLKQFHGYEVEKRPPPAPSKRKAAPAPIVPDEKGEGLPDPGSKPDPSGASALPDEDDAWTIKQWIAGGIELTDEEKATRPKADLVALIRAKAVTPAASE